MDSLSYNGDDLLKLFEELGIEIGNLNPNVIRAWFDTDNEDMKNFLNWLCVSITKKNVLSAQETEELESLPSLLTGVEYEKNIAKLDEEYPNIFDVEANVLEVELLEDEKDLYLKENDHLDKIIAINESISNEACSEICATINEEISSKLKCESAQKECDELAQKLDELNKKLREQMQKYADCLCDFEYATVPEFITNMAIPSEESLHINSSYLGIVIKRESQEIPDEDSLTKSVCSSAVEVLTDKISVVQNRIFQSRQVLMLQKTEMERLKAILEFLKNYTVNSVPSQMTGAQITMNLESKTEQLSVLANMLESMSLKYASTQVSQPKLNFALKELEVCQAKSDHADKLLDIVNRLSVISFIMHTLHTGERNGIKDSERFFKGLVDYISTDLQGCMLRAEAMMKIIDEFNIFNSQSLIKKIKLLEILMHLLRDEPTDDLIDIVNAGNELKMSIRQYQEELFNKNLEVCKTQSKEIEESIRALKKFLVCGPTCRIITLPVALYNSFKEIESHLNNQQLAIKDALQKTSEATNMLSTKKWLKLKRQLWMFFLKDPPKLLAVLKSAAEEFDKVKTSNL